MSLVFLLRPPIKVLLYHLEFHSVRLVSIRMCWRSPSSPFYFSSSLITPPPLPKVINNLWLNLIILIIQHRALSFAVGATVLGKVPRGETETVISTTLAGLNFSWCKMPRLVCLTMPHWMLGWQERHRIKRCLPPVWFSLAVSRRRPEVHDQFSRGSLLRWKVLQLFIDIVLLCWHRTECNYPVLSYMSMKDEDLKVTGV